MARAGRRTRHIASGEIVKFDGNIGFELDAEDRNMLKRLLRQDGSDRALNLLRSIFAAEGEAAIYVDSRSRE